MEYGCSLRMRGPQVSCLPCESVRGILRIFVCFGCPTWPIYQYAFLPKASKLALQKVRNKYLDFSFVWSFWVLGWVYISSHQSTPSQHAHYFKSFSVTTPNGYWNSVLWDYNSLHEKKIHVRNNKLNLDLDADSFLHLLSHFKCDSHTVNMLTQWLLAYPLTSAVKS